MAKAPEIRSAPLGLRVLPSVKSALEKAASDDHRSVASLAEKILTEWLRERSYLPEGRQTISVGGQAQKVGPREPGTTKTRKVTLGEPEEPDER